MTESKKRPSASDSWIPDLRTVDRGRIAEQILEDLRERILSGAVPRGARLPTERELAKAYGVSGATVREAIRALATMHMIEVRHGSGTYVTANAEQMIAQSLQSMIQLEKIGVQDILGVLAVLNVYVAELAATRATPDDVNALRSSLHELDRVTHAEDMEAALLRFLFALATASKNPLLAAICKFLAGLQVGFARQLAGGSSAAWRRTTGRLRKDRRNLVEAIARGDAAESRSLALLYHRRAMQVIDAMLLT